MIKLFSRRRTNSSTPQQPTSKPEPKPKPEPTLKQTELQPPYSLPIYQDVKSPVYKSLHINSTLDTVKTDQNTSFDILILEHNKVFRKLINGDNFSTKPNFTQNLENLRFQESGLITQYGYSSVLIENTVVMNQDQSLTIKKSNLKLQNIDGEMSYFNINFLKSLYNIPNLYTEQVLSDAFLTYINNNLIPLRDTKLGLNNLLVYLFTLNSSLRVNNSYEVLIGYTPTAEREYLIEESLTDYHKFFVLSSVLLPLTDEEIVDISGVRDMKLLDETFRSSYEETAIYNLRRALDYFKPDLSYIAPKDKLEKYPIKIDYYNPKLVFSLNYYKFLSYRMFTRYLNFLSTKEDFQNIQPFLSLVALNKETEDKINKILDKLKDSVLEGNKPSDDALYRTLEAVNRHFDSYFKPFDDEMTRLNSIFTKPSNYTTKIDNELDTLVSQLDE